MILCVLYMAPLPNVVSRICVGPSGFEDIKKVVILRWDNILPL